MKELVGNGNGDMLGQHLKSNGQGMSQYTIYV